MPIEGAAPIPPPPAAPPVSPQAQEAADAAAAIRAIESGSAPAPAPAPVAAPPPAVPEPALPPVETKPATSPLGGGAKPIEAPDELEEIARLAAERNRRAAERRRPRAPTPTPETPPAAAPPAAAAPATEPERSVLDLDVQREAEARGLTPAEYLYVVSQQVQKKAPPWKAPHAPAMTEIEKLRSRIEEVDGRNKELLSQIEAAGREAQQQEAFALEQRRNEEIQAVALKRVQQPEFQAKYEHIASQDPVQMAAAVASAFAANRDAIRRAVSEGREPPSQLTADQIFAGMETELKKLADSFAKLPRFKSAAAVPPAPTPQQTGAAPKPQVVAPQQPVVAPIPPVRSAYQTVPERLSPIRFRPDDDVAEIDRIVAQIEQASVGR